MQRHLSATNKKEKANATEREGGSTINRSRLLHDVVFVFLFVRRRGGMQ